MGIDMPFFARWEDGRVESRGLEEAGYGHILRSLAEGNDSAIHGLEKRTARKFSTKFSPTSSLPYFSRETIRRAKCLRQRWLIEWITEDRFLNVNRIIEGKKVSANDVCYACGGWAQQVEDVDYLVNAGCAFFTPAMAGGATALGLLIGVRLSKLITHCAA